MIRVEVALVIRRPRSAIYRFLRQPGAVASLQPFVVAIEHEPPIEPGSGGGPAAPCRFRAIEVVPIVPLLSRRWGLRTTLAVEQSNDDTGEGWVRLAVRAEGPAFLRGLGSVSGIQSITLEPVSAEPAGSGLMHTRVVNRFDIHSYPRGLEAFIRKSAESAHRSLVQRLKDKVEGLPAGASGY